VEFNITHFGNKMKRKGIHLVPDNWDDFGYKTTYSMFYIDEKNIEYDIGIVKFGEYGLENGGTNLPAKFKVIEENQFSLGQSADYYQDIINLGSNVSVEIFMALNDIAYSEEIFERAIKEEVTKKSLMRDVYENTVIEQFRRIANGGDFLASYSFKYEMPESLSSNNTFIFEVHPSSLPPTNIHAIIGTNGSGKTSALKGILAKYLEENSELSFASAIYVSFSVFDNINLNQEFSYIGIRNPDTTNKSLSDLSNEFKESIKNLIRRKQISKLLEILPILNADLNFASYSWETIIQEHMEMQSITQNSEKTLKKLIEIFGVLSSGHKIVLLTTAKLVDLIAEKTLIIIDEPETHLHPPLLSAFIRAISELIIRENAVAILATHSPVVLQEIPKSCVSILRRNGDYAQVQAPRYETFGENIGVLTEEIFGLEMTETGFHRLLKNAVNENPSYEDILKKFNNQLSLEAKSVVRAYINNSNGDINV
jgi:AAA15 family ATPase/GTPase